jgi:hypothetical protein
MSDLKISQVGFLIERSRLKAVRVNNVVNLRCAIRQGLFLLFRRRICTNVDLSFFDGDQCRINLVHGVVDEFSNDRWRRICLFVSIVEDVNLSAYIGNASEAISSPVRMSWYNSILNGLHRSEIYGVTS